MNSRPINIFSLISLIVWLSIFTAAVALTFGIHVATLNQQMNITIETPDYTAQDIDKTNRTAETNLTVPTETEIKSDTDLQNAFTELDTTELDELDALLEQNDFDAANF